MKYDYIIAGSGCAGLSLLYHILLHPTLRKKRILVLDMDSKDKNDRTWCFWEKEKGSFESIVYKKWNTLEFKTENFVNQFDMKDYTYKMIRGIDFYKHIRSMASAFENVVVRKEKVSTFQVGSDSVQVITENETYFSEYVFNSTNLLNPKIDRQNSLLQHFMGWVIKSDQANFNSDVGTLMDFSLDQKYGTTFMYVLPINSTEALVEYTLFTEKVLEEGKYVAAIEDYLENDLGIKSYQIAHREFGVIPMSKAKFPIHYKERIINVGTAGGNTKASSGYTFQFIQRNAIQMVTKLANGESPVLRRSFRQKMFDWYDKTLLDVMLSKKMSGKEIFSTMFRKVSPEKILTFLDNESSFKEDLQVMLSVTSSPFVVSGIRQLFQKE
ncbi:MAG: lycopene cyclase family protein [Bacteroidota bacterium]